MNPAASQFPIVTGNIYQAAPVYLEPIVGSGERITIAAVAIQGNEYRVEPTIPFSVLECAFGSNAKVFQNQVKTIISSLKGHLKTRRPLETWQPVYAGASLGSISEAIASSQSQALNHVITLCSALGHLSATAEELEDQPNMRTDRALTSWVAKIKQEITVVRRSLPMAQFNAQVRVVHGDIVRFGFVHNDYIANFGLVTAEGSRLSQRSKEIKAKLWDLQNAPNFNKREMILAVPSDEDPLMADDAVAQRVTDRIGALEHEADNNEMRLVKVHTAVQAADRLEKMAA